MAILRCQRCGNFVLSPPANMGDTCGKNGCWGTLSFYANTLVTTPKKIRLQCKTCGNVYDESPTRKIFGTCGVNGCTGRLDRYYG